MMQRPDLLASDARMTEEDAPADRPKIEQNTVNQDGMLPRILSAPLWYMSLVGWKPPQEAAQYVRDDLTKHVTGWPSDKLEEQANKFAKEAHHLGCVQYSRVSTALKSDRSLKRHMAIQAIIQEQKIIYLRQEISRLEEENNPKNSRDED